MTTKKHRETEIKIEIEEIESIRSRLLSRGFCLVEAKTFERNLVFDFPDQRLRRTGILLRLRHTKNHSLLTLKTPVRGDSRYKIRNEQEVEVSDFQVMADLLQGLGMGIFFIYEKYRETFGKNGVKVMIDETPIGLFLEIEGQPESIDRVRRSLGFRKSATITATYFQLFCRRGQGEHMVFPA